MLFALVEEHYQVLRADFAREYPSEPPLPTIWQDEGGLRWRDVDSLIWGLSRRAGFWESLRRQQAEDRGEVIPESADVDTLDAMRWDEIHHLIADVRDWVRLNVLIKGMQEGDPLPEFDPRPGMRREALEWRHDYHSDIAQAARAMLLPAE